MSILASIEPKEMCKTTALSFVIMLRLVALDDKPSSRVVRRMCSDDAEGANFPALCANFAFQIWDGVC